MKTKLIDSERKKKKRWKKNEKKIKIDNQINRFREKEGCKRRGDVGGLKRRKSRGGRVKEVREGEESGGEEKRRGERYERRG